MSEFSGDTTRFYEHYASRPLIVRDCFEPGHPLLALSLDAIENLLGDVSIPVYRAATSEHQSVPAAEIFAGVR